MSERDEMRRIWGSHPPLKLKDEAAMTTPTLMDAHKAAVETAWLAVATGGRGAAARAEAAESTFAARCAETEAELARLRAELRHANEVSERRNARICELLEQSLATRARVADVLRRAAKATRDERFSDDFQSEIHKAIAALLKELEP